MDYEKEKETINFLLASQENIINIINTSYISQNSRIKQIKETVETAKLSYINLERYSEEKKEKIKNIQEINKNILTILKEPAFDEEYKISVIRVIAHKNWDKNINLPSLESRKKRYIPNKIKNRNNP